MTRCGVIEKRSRNTEIKEDITASTRKWQRAEERRGEGGETGKVEREEWKPLFYQRQNENILT